MCNVIVLLMLFSQASQVFEARCVIGSYLFAICEHKGQLSLYRTATKETFICSQFRPKTIYITRDRVQSRQNNSSNGSGTIHSTNSVCTWKWNLCMIASHFGTFLSVGAVVQIHRQFACLDVSFYLLLPVVNERGGTDDQSAFRSHHTGIWMVNKQTNQNLQTLNITT